MKAALLSFTPNGGEVALRIKNALAAEYLVYDKSTSAAAFVAKCFSSVDALIFVGATGIAVRLIAPHLTSKAKDPAVIVIDERARYVIPILSGHIGGANPLAARLANELAAQCVTTTATDINDVFAADVFARRNGLIVADTVPIKHISGALLRGEAVGLISDFPIVGALPDGLVLGDSLHDCGVVISNDQTKRPFLHTLNLLPKNVYIGVGCRKNKNPEALERFLMDLLAVYRLSVKSVKCIASIDLKKEERAILAFAEKYAIETEFFRAEALNTLLGEFSASEFVQRTTGTDNVCERAVKMHEGVTLIQKKYTADGMSAAIGLGCVPLDFDITEELT